MVKIKNNKVNNIENISEYLQLCFDQTNEYLNKFSEIKGIIDNNGMIDESNVEEISKKINEINLIWKYSLNDAKKHIEESISDIVVEQINEVLRQNQLNKIVHIRSIDDRKAIYSIKLMPHSYITLLNVNFKSLDVDMRNKNCIMDEIIGHNDFLLACIEDCNRDIKQLKKLKESMYKTRILKAAIKEIDKDLLEEIDIFDMAILNKIFKNTLESKIDNTIKKREKDVSIYEGSLVYNEKVVEILDKVKFENMIYENCCI